MGSQSGEFFFLRQAASFDPSLELRLRESLPK